jgi:hypothetical protein
MASAETPQLLIYDDMVHYESSNSAQSFYAKIAAKKANWQSLFYNEIEYAVEDFDASIGALVVCMSNVGMDEDIARPLFVQATELKIPKALVCSRGVPTDGLFNHHEDVFINRFPVEAVETRLFAWLTSLGGEIQTDSRATE